MARTTDGKFTLRESAQVHKQDEKAFENISRHRYFNTNNIWLNLEKLRNALTKDGLFKLPLIANEKKLDPTGKDDVVSPIPQFSEPKPGAGATVVQVETAMGAAISLFSDAKAVIVPSDRFLPVKTNAQLAVLRSEAFTVAEDFTLMKAPRPRAPVDPLLKQLPPMLKSYAVMAHAQQLHVEAKTRKVAGVPELAYTSDGKPISPWHNIPLFSNALNAVFEIPKNSSAIARVSSSTGNPIKQVVQRGKLGLLRRTYLLEHRHPAADLGEPGHQRSNFQALWQRPTDGSHRDRQRIHCSRNDQRSKATGFAAGELSEHGSLEGHRHLS